MQNQITFFNVFTSKSFSSFVRTASLMNLGSSKHFFPVKSFIIEGPQIIHYGGASSNNIDYEVLDTAKFSMINLFISRIYFCKKNFNGKLKLLLLKLYTTLIWLNPLIVKKTGKNILKIWKI